MAINFAKHHEPPPIVERLVARAERKAAPQGKRAGGRPKSDNPKVVLNIRVDADVLERWRNSGEGWQSRINDVLKIAKP